MRPISQALSRPLGALAGYFTTATRSPALRHQQAARISEQIYRSSRLLSLRHSSGTTTGRLGGGGGGGSGGFFTAQTVLRSSPRRGFRFSAWRGAADKEAAGKAQENLSLGARLKKLSREYGWAAAGVYLSLSILDFPFFFLLVRMVGTETIGRIEHVVMSNVKSFVPESIRNKASELWQSIRQAEKKETGADEITDKAEMAGWGVAEAQERANEEASLATQLALAYAVHKSFIFVRVPLTAAITPKVVKVLRSWGWNIGKRTPKP